MIIRNNKSATNTNRNLSLSSTKQSKVLEKLSSGLRINRAADDAAGLSVSEKMRAQMRALNQANRNAQDGVSLIQVADGALGEVSDILKRVKELSTQAANGTYSNDDKQNIQLEINSLLKNINQIANNTKFNNLSLLDGSCASNGVSYEDKLKFMSWLNGSWLNDAAQKIESTTGWKLSSDTSLTVTFESTGDSAVAYMSGWYGGSDLKLAISTEFMEMGTDYKGTDGPTLGGIPADRLITHEMTHGYMFNNVSSTAKPPFWFIEGLAEAVHGGNDYRYNIYEECPVDDFTSVNSQFQNFDFLNNDGSSLVYTVGDLATSYLYTQIENKSTGSFKTMMAEMDQSDETFEQLVVKYTGAADYASFVGTMKQAAQNAFDAGDYNGLFLKDKCNIDLNDGKADPLDGNDQFSSDVIQNTGSAIEPTGLVTTLTLGSTDITVHWGEDSLAHVGAIKLQVGDKEDQSMEVSIKGVKTSDLGIDNISVVSGSMARNSIEACDNAINTVLKIRAELGADQNRLGHIINNLSNTSENLQASESKIRDTNMANEMMSFVKNNILIQASQSLLVQANQMPNYALKLLQS